MGIEVLCVSVVALLIGLTLLFAGYRLFLVLLPVWGFFAGFFIGASALAWLFGEGFLATVAGWILGFVVGMVFAVLSYLFYMIGVALISGAIGYGLGSGLVFLIFEDAQLIAFIVGLVVAVVVAVLVLVLNVQKWVIVFLTAFGGASALFTSAALLFNQVEIADLGSNPVRPLWDQSPFWFIVWLVVALIGIVAQFSTARGYELEPPESGRVW